MFSSQSTPYAASDPFICATCRQPCVVMVYWLISVRSYSRRTCKKACALGSLRGRRFQVDALGLFIRVISRNGGQRLVCRVMYRVQSALAFSCALAALKLLADNASFVANARQPTAHYTLFIDIINIAVAKKKSRTKVLAVNIMDWSHILSRFCSLVFSSYSLFFVDKIEL